MGSEKPIIIKEDIKAVKINCLPIKKQAASPTATVIVVISAICVFIIFGDKKMPV